MSGNGVLTGMENIPKKLKRIHRGQNLVLYAYCAAAAGTTLPGTVVQRFATATRQRAGTATLASGSSCLQVRSELKQVKRYQAGTFEHGGTAGRAEPDCRFRQAKA